MSRADDLAAKAARLRGAGANLPPAAGRPAVLDPAVATEVRTSVATEVRMADVIDGSAPAARPAVRTRPVRLTVDIPPAEHAQLSQLALSAAAELGLARVHGQEIVRVLISRYLSDPTQQRQVLADVDARRRLR